MVLGRTGLARKGNWAAAAVYDALDIVTHDGKVYISKQSSTGSEPSSGSADWMMFPDAPSFEIEETASGYDLTITGSDGTSETISILNGEVDREELEDALEAFRSSTDAYLAPDYDDTATYSIGDSCIHDGRLYRCIVNIPVAELWTIGHWKPVVLADTMAQMRKDAVVKADVITSSFSGEIVTIQDGAKNLPVVDLSLSLLPVQNLNGQDAPYPPGGGKNKLNAISDNILSYSGYRNFTFANGVVTITGNTLMGFKVPVSPSTDYAATFLKSASDTVNIRIRLYSDNPTSWEASSFISQPVNSGVSGLQAKVTFTTTAETQYVIVSVYRSGAPSGTLTISNWMLELGTLVTDYAPYSNICPISGWSGVDITHVDNDYFRGVTIEQGTITSNGNVQASDYRVRFANRITLGKGTYKIYANPTLYGTIRVYNVGGSYIEAESITAWTLLDGAEFTLVGERDVKLSMTSNTSQNVPIVPSDVKSVIACKVRTVYPISWQSSAGAVYGGSLDVITGLLSVDWVKYRFTKEDSYSGWEKSAGEATTAGGWITVYHTIATAYQATPDLGDDYGRFNWGVWASSSSVAPYPDGNRSARAYITSSKGRISIVFFNKEGIDISDLATCKTWVEGICGDDYSIYPEAVFKLATPTTYQLTPTQISTLLGANNFWSNGNGQIDLEYRADLKLYLEQLTKPTEDDMVANSNIPANTYFNVGNALYLSTAAITAGEKIEPDTNCTRKSLADALNDLHE